MRVADGALDGVEASKGADDERPAKGRWRSALPWIGGAAVVLALLLGAVALQRANDRPATLTPAQVASTVSSLVQQGVAEAQSAPSPSVAVFQAIRPSLVYIEAARSGGTAEDTASGAGVVVDAQGQILTARHVVTGADSIEVTFADGTKTAAQIVSEQPDQDIAVLQPGQPPSVIVPAVLGGGVRIGDDVYAVGHPLGLVDSLTAGVVSGLNRIRARSKAVSRCVGSSSSTPRSTRATRVARC